MQTSYHYRLLALLLVAGCANAERTAPVTEPAVVPSLAGAPVSGAVDALQAAGLQAALEAAGPTPSPLPLTACADGSVLAQDTPPGTSLVRGSQVVLTVTACP